MKDGILNKDYQFFATCSKGVEDLVLKELEQLGISETKTHTGGIGFKCGVDLAYKACLWSRVASRILLQLKAFEILSDDDLYKEIISIDWSEHFDEEQTLTIDCFSSHSVVNNSHYATLRVKDAIVDQFMQNTSQRPSIDRDDPDIRVNLYLSDKECLLYLDLSGDALHKRGYRKSAGSAPIRETLAASMLYRAKWPDYCSKGLPFYDPMCGSGTIVIEAVMMAASIAPGLLREQSGRKFGFYGWKQFDSQAWKAILDEAEEKRKLGLRELPVICGSDNDEKLVGIARNNINDAGLPSFIKISLQDATKDLGYHTDEQGLIVTNPPYGKRIGQVQLLRTLYHRFGQQLKANFNGWTAVVITTEQELAKSIGMRAFRKNTLFNGALKSVLYQYKINSIGNPFSSEQDSEPDTEDNENVWTKGKEKNVTKIDDKASEHALMFGNRLKKNYKHLKKWARKNNITCYRVYDADIPQYAVAIDIYDKWVHVQEYQAPKTVDKNRAFQRINDVIDVVADILETKQENVVLKVRKKQEGSAQYQKQDAKDYKITVLENDLKFIINMYDYIDTGLFLDHRNTRQLVKALAKKRSFLNLFAYTGSVSVYAAAGGARTTTTVDMSNTYLNWAKDNFSLNGYTNECNQFDREDCLKWMEQAIAENKKYQLIFIDPPTFSNSKKMETSLDINRDHSALLSGCLALLTDDGQIIFSTNAKKFKLDSEVSEDCFIKEITSITTTEDFKRKPIHRSWCLAKQESALALPKIN
ncbi:23S rRNA (guanine(2445)-N(2))-methyltransferase / 23S rRNA (guanine(2069)-N(7))-methyltransferase [hydrothermal vent metagenome]|uniref:23S rRNA (Guanine(2445)-N(2))-methyltransferase / 23S rRNA (Guanine(2069)-N(7))-methyltransferase n=1 Tax=hydrothermal vent metagenome TaxID=652676 RepID=A0A3B0W9V2_9ZZZZ